MRPHGFRGVQKWNKLNVLLQLAYAGVGTRSTLRPGAHPNVKQLHGDHGSETTLKSDLALSIYVYTMS